MFDYTVNIDVLSGVAAFKLQGILALKIVKGLGLRGAGLAKGLEGLGVFKCRA